jgi:hypothetical protein
MGHEDFQYLRIVPPTHIFHEHHPSLYPCFLHVDGWVLWGFVGVKRKYEVYEYGSLDWRELAIPQEINSDISLQQWAVVVLEDNRLLFNEREHACGGDGRIRQREKQEKWD